MKNFNHLAAQTNLSLEQLQVAHQRYSSDNKSTDSGRFWVYLQESGMISKQTLFDLVSTEQIIVTDIEQLQRHQSKQESQIDGSSDLEAPSSDNETDENETFDLLGKVGEGAMGEIYLARDMDLQRTVAVKRLLPEITANDNIMTQFLNEVQITAQLEHPNVIPIYNLEVLQDGSFSYSMKLIQGDTLKELIQQARHIYKGKANLPEELSISGLLEQFLKVCDAMEYAHNKGVIHRDLKPANIMIGAYKEVCVMDWGISRVIGVESNEEGKIIGTPRYLSPEQAAGFNDRLDGRSDLFSLGLILAELINLKPLFKPGKDLISTVQKIIKNQREPLESYHPNRPIPRELKAIVAKATERKRKDRYQTVGNFAEDIRRYLRGESVLVQPDNTMQKGMRWISKNKEKAATLMLILLLSSVSFVAWSTYQQYQNNIKSQKHEKELNRVLTDISQKSQSIDRYFFFIKSLLEQYVAATQQLLENGKTSEGKYYTRSEFTQQITRPADTTWSEGYQMDISSEYPVVNFSYGVKHSPLKPKLKKLVPLKEILKKPFFDAAQEHYKKEFKSPELNEMMRKGKVPITWSYVGFKEGFNITFPGKKNYPDKYDARTRPWYVRGKKRKDAHWQEPYFDSSGTGLVLPAVKSIHTSQGEFLGVGSMDLPLSFVRDNLITWNHSGVLDTALLNEKGEVMIHASSSDQRTSKPILKKAKKQSLYEHTKVIEKIKRKESGYIIESGDNGNIIYAFYRLSTRGWYYLIKVEENLILEEYKVN